MNDTNKLLEVRDLHKAYSKEGVPTQALNGITFDVLNGDVYKRQLMHRMIENERSERMVETILSGYLSNLGKLSLIHI